MKKLLFFLLLISGIAFAQPPIAQPADISACDINQTGFGTFDLTANNVQILNGLNASLYEIKFYNTLSAAVADGDFITTPTAYTNSSNMETIFVRVHEIADTANYATTSFNLVVNPLPVFTLADVTACEGTVVELNSGITEAFLYQWFYNGTLIPGANESNFFVTEAGTYSMTATTAAGCVYSDEAVVTFIPSAVASISGPTIVNSGESVVLTFTGTPTAVVTYTFATNSINSLPQTISLDASGSANIVLPPITTTTTVILISVTLESCTIDLSSSLIVAINPNSIINIPDANFKAKLLSASPFNVVAENVAGFNKVDINNDGEIQVSEAAAIIQLNIGEANISDLTGIIYFTNLQKLACFQNQLVSLDVSSLVNLEFLACSANLITDLNVSGLTNLKELFCDYNELSNVNVLGLFNLEKFSCSENQLSNLDLSGLVNLKYIYCGWNQLSTIDLSEFINLEIFDCRHNLFSNIDLTGLVNLKELFCGWNQFTILDLSAFSNFISLGCNNNPTLTYISLKNGSSETYLSFSDCPNLTFVCGDEDDTIDLQAEILSNGYINCNINTYCSFTPGGDFNTISGTTRFDTNNNGCDLIDANIPFLSFDVSLNGVDTTSSVLCNSVGKYGLFTDQVGVFSLIPNLENPTYFTVSPNPATVNIPLIDNSTITQNFCITANGVHPDLEIVIVPIMPARPGFDAVYKIVYKNKGNQTVTGVVNFTYNDAVLDFVSSSVVPGNNGAGIMNWTIPNLAPFQVGSILVTLNVNSPQETPAVNIDDVLVFNAFIDVTTDDNWADNTFNFSQIVVGSYDPNDITCLQGNSLPLNNMGNFLHYNIRFENTGTAPAENIVVKSIIELSQYNLQSLQVMESSHPMEVKITGNVVEFIFQTINLDTGGHGNILLKMKSNNALSNNYVMNSADIFFDYNFPIETNDEQTVFADLSKNDFNKDLSLQVYPNPTHTIVTIKSDSTINAIQLYDAQGRLLITKMTNDNLQTIDLSSYATGIYYLSVSTTSGKQTQKVIKK